MIPYEHLVPGKVYYIYQPATKYLKDDYYRGMFVVKTYLYNLDSLVSHFEDVSALKPFEYMGYGYFGQKCIYYEADKIKENATIAKQKMEKRALDIVLKSILNEDFIWF